MENNSMAIQYLLFSDIFLKRVVLGKIPMYEIAETAGIDGPVLSRILNTPYYWKNRETWKKHVYSIGDAVGLKPEECLNNGVH